jgi:hypothetical protein
MRSPFSVAKSSAAAALAESRESEPKYQWRACQLRPPPFTHLPGENSSTWPAGFVRSRPLIGKSRDPTRVPLLLKGLLEQFCSRRRVAWLRTSRCLSDGRERMASRIACSKDIVSPAPLSLAPRKTSCYWRGRWLQGLFQELDPQYCFPVVLKH